VYLLYSRPINTIVIPKLHNLVAKFFTPTKLWTKYSFKRRPTSFNVYNPNTIFSILCIIDFRSPATYNVIYWLGFIKKIKTFSYNKKDLAWGIESMLSVWQPQQSIGYIIRLTRIKITQIAIFTPPIGLAQYSINTITPSATLLIWETETQTI
jgi:hypothetical protein